VDVPETRFITTVDGVSIAYQVIGQGPIDIMYVPSAWTSNMETAWEWPTLASFFRELASRGRVVLFDRRGTGLSDSVSGDHLPTLEAVMEDIRCVMDAAGSERAVLWALEDGAAHALLFAATYPERTRAVITSHASVRGIWAPDAPWAWTEEQWAEERERVQRGWGTLEYVQYLVDTAFPDHAHDPDFIRGYGRHVRHSLRKADALAAFRMWMDTDVRQVLPTIQVPTLVMHLAEDMAASVEEGRYIAGHIPGAIFVELPGADHVFSTEFEHVDRFLASLRDEEAEFDRVLATVLFTDIVGSTRTAAELGDRAWRDLLQRHHATVRAMLGRYRGTEIDTSGDGFFATFDGPARGVRCAKAIIEAVRPLGLEVRAGLHTGEVETIDEKVAGIAVHIGERVGTFAGRSEIMVSQTVKDLVAGSGLVFEDAGEHDLKGVPERWHLYRVVESSYE
jgi:class 3 adenylate cyclase